MLAARLARLTQIEEHAGRAVDTLTDREGKNRMRISDTEAIGQPAAGPELSSDLLAAYSIHVPSLFAYAVAQPHLLPISALLIESRVPHAVPTGRACLIEQLAGRTATPFENRDKCTHRGLSCASILARF